MARLIAYQVFYLDGNAGPEVECSSPGTAYLATKDIPGVLKVDFITNIGRL